eukprot:6754654-Ditylum_brightwellii.AAC.1
MFTITLPQEKAAELLHLLEILITNCRSSFKELKSVIDRLNHIGFIIPNARHFLSWICNVLPLLCKYNQPFSLQVIVDLQLWKGFICYAAEGISINNVVYQATDIVVWSDASLHGIGGYSSNWDVWCWKLPAKLIGLFTFNALEFLAAAIPLDRALSCSPKNSCYVGITNSSSIAGWLYKSSFGKGTHPEHL